MVFTQDPPSVSSINNIPDATIGVRDSDNIAYIGLEQSDFPTTEANQNDVALATSEDQYYNFVPQKFKVENSTLRGQLEIEQFTTQSRGIHIGPPNPSGVQNRYVHLISGGGPENGRIFEFKSLNNKIEFSTFSLNQNIESSSPSSRDLTWSNDGQFFFEAIGGFSPANSIVKREPDNTADFQIHPSNNPVVQTSDVPSATESITFNDDGTKLYTTDGDIIKQFSTSAPFDISNLTFDTDIQKNTTLLSLKVRFNNDGTKMYEMDPVFRQFAVSELSTPFDISSNFNSQLFSFPANIINGRGFDWQPEGDRYFMVQDETVAGDSIFDFQCPLEWQT